ncbi:hypothetical protein JTE90_010496 [Oedothorax gibbosus]|uniref:Uncharacterized protein n=1 Tax=Oedothorax gibbosus TaxID=931172 RepID=A0AAV6W0J2_9ARAC|nr:hypothetical protein JTE90_010496 [Oedothorax gibbosus]
MKIKAFYADVSECSWQQWKAFQSLCESTLQCSILENHLRLLSGSERRSLLSQCFFVLMALISAGYPSLSPPFFAVYDI